MSGAGFLDRRITLQRATTERNWFNETIETWNTLAAVYANKADASASESYRAQEVGADITARFTIRYSTSVADLNPRDRLSFDGLLYNITGVREKQRKRWIEIDCVARADVAAVDETSP
jgi:SPP1 family predicted phage head-tail adaptor